MSDAKDTQEKFVIKVAELVQTLRNEVDLITTRLRISSGYRDKLAHKRAYNELSHTVRLFLQKMPKVEVQAEKPVFVRTGPSIPFVIKKDAVFMGCPTARCYEWIDVSRIFSQQIFDGEYECPKHHKTYFAGVKTASDSPETKVTVRLQ